MQILHDLDITFFKDAPYVMINDEMKDATGNLRFEGFCMDLVKKVAEQVKFNYTVEIVKDGKYGAASGDGEWDGMIGELIRNVSRTTDRQNLVIENYRNVQSTDMQG